MNTKSRRFLHGEILTLIVVLLGIASFHLPLSKNANGQFREADPPRDQEPTSILDVDSISRNVGNDVLGQGAKHNPGAFMPVNDNNVAPGQKFILPIIVRAVQNRINTDTIKLTCQNGMTVYSDAACATAVTDQNISAPTKDTTFYVKSGSSKGPGKVRLFINKRQVDYVLITAFIWNGPHNVPQFANYDYSILDSGDLPDQGKKSKWISIDNGGVVDITPPNTQSPTNVFVKWGAGPLIGKINFKVNESYNWDLGVNVVQVQVEPSPGTGNSGPDFVLGYSHDEGFVGGIGTTGNRVLVTKTFGTGANEPAAGKPIPGGWRNAPMLAIQYGAKVTFIWASGTDPATAAGEPLAASFIQNLTGTNCSGTYSFNNASLSYYAKNIQGITFWDGADHSSKLYNSKIYTPNATPSSAGPFAIASSDAPYLNVPAAQVYKSGTYQLNSVNIDWNFDLYVVAYTNYTNNKYRSNNIYVGEAIAKWEWAMSGGLPVADTQIKQNQDWQAMTATSANPGVDPISNPSAPNNNPPKTAAPMFNDIVNTPGPGWTITN